LNRSFIFWELIKSAYGAGIIFYTGDWFGMSKYYSMTNSVALSYFMISIIVTFYLGMESKKLEQALQG
jgi:hypothetical protein